MKKNMIIICLVFITLSITAFGFMKNSNSVTNAIETANNENGIIEKPVDTNTKEKSNPNFVFAVGTRFKGIKKEDLINLKSFDDYIGQAHVNRIVSYKTLSVVLLENNDEPITKITTDSGILSLAQLELLKSFEYSTNLMLGAEYTEKWTENGKIEDSSWTPYLTIIPETQAFYNNGKDDIIDYFRQNITEEITNISPDILKSGRIFFNVTKEGLISNVEVVATSGLPMVDEKIKKLISKLSRKWEPAKTINGDKVDQVLVISYGKKGC